MIRLLLIALCVLPCMLSAQANWELIQIVDGDEGIADSVIVGFHDSPEFSQKEVERSIPSLNAEYSGFAIELIASDYLLAPNHPAFSDFGRIYLVQSDNKFHYLFLIDYHRRKSVKQFYRKIVKPKAPNAIVVQYLDGIQTTEFSW